MKVMKEFHQGFLSDVCFHQRSPTSSREDYLGIKL